MAQSPGLTTALFVDPDEDALNRILTVIEPVVRTISLRTWRPILGYIQTYQPQVLVLSDRVAGGEAKLRAVIADIRAHSTVPVLLLVDELTPDVTAYWKDAGVAGLMVHPTRMEARIDAMLQRILSLAHDAEGAH
jgi:hypothetical protein